MDQRLSIWNSWFNALIYNKRKLATIAIDLERLLISNQMKAIGELASNILGVADMMKS